MKELHNFKADKLEIHQEQNQKVENKYIGTCYIKTGCKLWAYNPENDEMKEQKLVKKGAVDFTGQVIEAKKAQHNPRYIYFQAINEKNARKKLARYKAGEYNIAEIFEKKQFENLKDVYGF